jgi:broad specificity phosphatase PhoE
MADALRVEGTTATDVGLREYNIGEWSGLTRGDIATRWPAELLSFDRGELDAPPGGESREEFDLRVAAAGRRIAHLSASTKGARVLLVTHGGVVRSFARLAGLAERHVGHLAGYWGVSDDSGIQPCEPVDLLSPGVPSGHGEGETAQASL